MENSIYIGLSRQMALRDNMDIIANNIANANTPGYRGQNLLFTQFISDPKGTDAPLSMVYDSGAYRDTVSGPVQVTSNPLDIALTGPGFIGVKGQGGKTAYTRDGGFQISPDGTLVTNAGTPVSSKGGSTISIPKTSTEIHIDAKGVVSNQSGQLGQIKIVEFADAQKLTPLGNNMYQTTAAEQPATHTTVAEGQIEGSNVKPILEMTRMIETLRNFQAVQGVLDTEHSRIREAIQTLTRAT